MRLLQLARFAVREVLQRTAADWRIQSTAGIGILLAVGLMAAAVIYSSALGETALRRTIDDADPIDTDLAVRLSHRLERPPYDDSQDFLSGRVIARMQPFLSGTEQLVESDTLFFEGLPQLEGPFESRVRGTVLAPTSLAEHITLGAGRMPGPSASGELEVLVDTAGASLLDLSVGDEMVGFPALLQTIEGAPTVPVRIVGIFSPTDFGNEYWRIGVHDRLSEPSRDWTTLRLYADFDEMFDTLGEAIRGMTADFSWFLFLDREDLGTVEAARLRNALRGAAADSFSTLDPDPGWDTQLDTMLRRYFALLVLTRIPLFLMVSLALGLLLYYLFLVAGFLGQARASETSLFRTRGASLTQLGTVIMLEGLVITIPAILIGPFAAWGGRGRDRRALPRRGAGRERGRFARLAHRLRARGGRRAPGPGRLRHHYRRDGAARRHRVHPGPSPGRRRSRCSTATTWTSRSSRSSATSGGRHAQAARSWSERSAGRASSWTSRSSWARCSV